MAGIVKRKHEDEDDQCPNKKSKSERNSSDRDIDFTMSRFISWCREHNFQLSPKVTVSRDGSCAQWGMQATEDIAESYCIFQIPRTELLMPTNSSITNLIDIEDPKLTSSNQWIPLLLTLLYETKKPDSKWEPYLGLAPHPEAIDLPMFWGQAEVDRLLKGTGVDKAVRRDLDMIESDYNKFVLPFKQKTAEKFIDNAMCLNSFKRMVAFVMAYSFTEPAVKEDEEDDEDDDESQKMQPPMMVPMADMLNHITKHNAKLTFGSKALKMVTTRTIKKEIIDEDDVVVLGREGILNDDICTQVLKVLCMSSAEFAEYMEKEGWSDAESEASDAETNTLDMTHLPQLDQKQKMILKRMGELHLQNYAISFEDAKKKMERATSLPARERYALYTVHGQQMLLSHLVTACNI
ncbi:N-lysine methyltransferase setd6 [Elysia marginata]|uniref:N-lysine methyltransferase setd6 n=1 Tax=Elysia marginata TaxID=1093978 RepID=A0AAV4F752_9GAST|nr:N-lysine methyltransferase setd6 [Elysia marginata]